MSTPPARDRHARLRPSGLNISLLGPPGLTCGGRSLYLPRRDARALLFRLAVQSYPVPRGELAFLFWPDCPDAHARRTLTFLLGKLQIDSPPETRAVYGAILEGRSPEQAAARAGLKLKEEAVTPARGPRSGRAGI